MRLIKPSYEIMEQASGLIGMKKHIELAKRVCYKSEHNITEDSYEDAVNGLIKSGHTSVLEHGAIYLYFEAYFIGGEAGSLCEKYLNNKHSIVSLRRNGEYLNYYVTTNYRVLVENGWLNDLQYMCEPTEYHEKRYTVRFICDRGVSHEYVRHRVDSFSQESTRYCNYSKDDSDQLNIISPCWLELTQDDVWTDEDFFDMCEYLGKFSNYKDAAQNSLWSDIKYWFFANMASEFSYQNLIRLGWRPQQARSILPTDLKTELIVSAFAKDWEHFFSLRDDNAAHPQAKELATPLHEEFKRRGYV